MAPLRPSEQVAAPQLGSELNTLRKYAPGGSIGCLREHEVRVRVVAEDAELTVEGFVGLPAVIAERQVEAGEIDKSGLFFSADLADEVLLGGPLVVCQYGIKLADFLFQLRDFLREMAQLFISCGDLLVELVLLSEGLAQVILNIILLSLFLAY